MSNSSPPIAGTRKRHYQFTAIADCTRLRILKLYNRFNQKTAIQFIDYALERLPFRVELIQTDNGAEFASTFHWHVLGVQRRWYEVYEGPPGRRHPHVSPCSSQP